ncbi:L,D-transpeptidase family protein [Streptomyces sp. NPDC058751]|uniref:L,D-transpeptidase family protein n=1 Tax=Streptomyces sp. NPDC058751 TaxID=3346623 RepID=UPI0036C70456
MDGMRKNGATRGGLVATVCGALAVTLSACGGAGSGSGDGAESHAGVRGGGTRTSAAAADPTRIPGVGDRLQRQIPADSRQVLAVYGEGEDSADSTAVLYTKSGTAWKKTRGWDAHNGRKGWTTDHHEDDRRSPVGVFTLSDAGGVLDDPGSRLPYTQSETFQAPHGWPKRYWHDFDYVIAIDYNRIKGNPPNDPARPWGDHRGGGIWLHMDHGSGTSACVSLSRAAMEYLLRTLDPERHPVVVMGDRANLRA